MSAWGGALGGEPATQVPHPHPALHFQGPNGASLCLQVRSQARLRVQVPAVCSAPVVSTRTSGDLPARPSNDPAEERCQVEGGV